MMADGSDLFQQDRFQVRSINLPIMKTTITTFATVLALALTATAQSQTETSTPIAGANSTSTAQTPAPGTTSGTTDAATITTAEGIDAASRQLFQRLDTNNDGSLSRDEFMRMPSLSGAPTGTSPAGTGTGTSTSPTGTGTSSGTGTSPAGTGTSSGTSTSPGSTTGSSTNPQR